MSYIGNKNKRFEFRCDQDEYYYILYMGKKNGISGSSWLCELLDMLLRNDNYFMENLSVRSGFTNLDSKGAFPNEDGKSDF